ncbi:DUF1127 domain-containing protein [Lichenibacterium minor]
MWDALVLCRDAAEVAWARRRVSAELEALSDRYLADMGLERWDIPAHVRSVLPWPASPVRPQPRYRPSLRGCG